MSAIALESARGSLSARLPVPEPRRRPPRRDGLTPATVAGPVVLLSGQGRSGAIVSEPLAVRGGVLL